jgi:hypothetical protein
LQAGDQHTAMTVSDYNYYLERIVTLKGKTDYIVKKKSNAFQRNW